MQASVDYGSADMMRGSMCCETRQGDSAQARQLPDRSRPASDRHESGCGCAGELTYTLRCRLARLVDKARYRLSCAGRVVLLERTAKETTNRRASGDHRGAQAKRIAGE